MQLRRTLEMNPNFSLAYWTLAWAYQKKGMQKEFLAALEKTDWRVMILAASGRRAEAKRLLAEERRRAAPAHSVAPGMAQVYGHLGKMDEAFAWLEKSFQERDGWLIVSKVAPEYEPLRSDPRFDELVRRVGLP